MKSLKTITDTQFEVENSGVLTTYSKLLVKTVLKNTNAVVIEFYDNTTEPFTILDTETVARNNITFASVEALNTYVNEVVATGSDSSEDTSSNIIKNITDWESFYHLEPNIGIDDLVLYNNRTYKNLTGNITLVPPDADTTNWELRIAVRWESDYTAGSPQVEGTMVRELGWTMLANKDTSEPAAPRPYGETINIYDGTLPTVQDTSKQLLFGTRYRTIDSSIYAHGYRIFTVIGNSYSIYFISDPLGTPILSFQLSFVATTAGWTDVAITPTLVVQGTVFDIIVQVSEPDPAPITFSGNWSYIKSNQLPLPGEITHPNNATDTINIHKFDNDGTDRSLELAGLTIGDIVRTEALSWAIQSINDLGTYVIYNIAPAAQLPLNGLTEVFFDTIAAVPITYGIDTDYYISEDAVSGLYSANGSYRDVVENENAYGVDLLVQGMTASGDWDIITPADGSSVAGGTTTSVLEMQSFLNQVVVTDSGDDRGVLFTGQVEVLDELIVGPDSSPAPIAFHCKMANTTGKTIVNAVDVTEILKTDSDSVVGMFGGNSAGDYLLIGAIDVFEGAKVKYTDLGDFDSDNLIPEYYSNDVDEWNSVFFMGTDANYPHEAYGNMIANSPSEQVFFGFNPLLRGTEDEWVPIIFNIDGVDYTYRWTRFRLTGDILQEPTVEQIKLHTDRIEIEPEGIFKFGKARSTIALAAGIKFSIPNSNIDPANENVKYTPTFSAALDDNEFQNNRDDGFGLTINRVEGLDTSVPIVLGISFYVKGNSTGNINFRINSSQVTDGYVYDGANIAEEFTTIVTVDTPSNEVRQSIQVLLPINTLQNNSGLLVEVSRLAATDPLDTLNGSVIITNLIVEGTAWKI